LVTLAGASSLEPLPGLNRRLRFSGGGILTKSTGSHEDPTPLRIEGCHPGWEDPADTDLSGGGVLDVVDEAIDTDRLGKRF